MVEDYEQKKVKKLYKVFFKYYFIYFFTKVLNGFFVAYFLKDKYTSRSLFSAFISGMKSQLK
jgi:hypothetical protein